MKRVWPDTFVESGSLAFNIFALRKALGDDRLNGNRYIETVPKRGYRFIAPVVPPDLGASNAVAEEKCPADPPLAAPWQAVSKVRNGRGIGMAGATLTAAALLGYLVSRPLPPPGILGSIQLTHDGRQKWLAPGGRLTLYFNEATGNGPVIAQVPISGGDTLRFHTPFETCGAFDVSARRQEMLLTVAPCGRGPGLCGRHPGLAAHRGASGTCLPMVQAGRPMDERSHTTENRASTLSMPMPPVRIGSPHSPPALEIRPPVRDGPPTGNCCASKPTIPKAGSIRLGRLHPTVPTSTRCSRVGDQPKIS